MAKRHQLLKLLQPYFFNITLSGLLAGVVLSFALVEHNKPVAAAQNNALPSQSVFFAYWSVDDGFTSTVVLNNAGDAPLDVQPTLYNLRGQAHAAAPITLQPKQQVRASIADWIDEGSRDTFKRGNLALSFMASHPLALGAQVTVTNPAASLSFDVPPEMLPAFASPRLEGIWQEGERYELVLTNTTANSVSTQLSFTAARPSAGVMPVNLVLESHQTQVINLRDLNEPHIFGAGTAQVGGISITHTGAPGAVLAYGMLANSERGFSTHFPFVDPVAKQSLTLAAAHLLTGKPDVPGLPSQTSFSSVALLRNASDSPLEVTPTVSFMSGQKPRTQALPVRSLSPQEVAAVNIGTELKRAGVRGDLSAVGLTLSATGQPGALIAHLSSYDRTANYVFDVPLKDPALAASPGTGGNYPWTIAGELYSIIHVRNTTDQKALFTVQLNFAGGSYTLPIQSLAQQQESAIDIRYLRDMQIKDSIGRVIPREVTSGQAIWNPSQPQALIGRMETYDASAATASSYSCSTPCSCTPQPDSLYFSPDSMVGLVGDTESGLRLLETTRVPGCNVSYGPFDVTRRANVWSNDTTVATLGALSPNGYEVNCLAVGETSFGGEFPTSTEPPPGGTGSCPDPGPPLTTTMPMTVIPVRYTRVAQDFGTARFGDYIVTASATLSLPNTSPPCTGSAFQMKVYFDKGSNATLYSQNDVRNFVETDSAGQYRVNGWALENATSSSPDFNARLQRINPSNTNKPIRFNVAGYSRSGGFSVAAYVTITCN